MRHTEPLSWDQGEIDWLSVREGFVEAKVRNRPMILAYFTHWCPDCHNISLFFEDERVVRLARSFIMIWANRDEDVQTGQRYHRDGTYVPRLQFLTPDGELIESLTSGREEDIYFYEAHHLEQWVSNMEAALKL